MSEPDGAPNPYQAPQAAADTEGLAVDITREELMAFAGPAGGHYWARWVRGGQRDRLWHGWSWPAALVSLLWFAYRRMWREFLVILGIQIGFGLLEWVALEQFGHEILPGVWWQMLVESLIFGALGCGLYLRRARLEIGKARRAFPDDPARQAAELASVGGTSWWWVLAGIGVNLAVALMQGGLARLVARFA